MNGSESKQKKRKVSESDVKEPGKKKRKMSDPDAENKENEAEVPAKKKPTTTAKNVGQEGKVAKKGKVDKLVSKSDTGEGTEQLIGEEDNTNDSTCAESDISNRALAGEDKDIVKRSYGRFKQNIYSSDDLEESSTSVDEDKNDEQASDINIVETDDEEEYDEDYVVEEEEDDEDYVDEEEAVSEEECEEEGNEEECEEEGNEEECEEEGNEEECEEEGNEEECEEEGNEEECEKEGNEEECEEEGNEEECEEESEQE